MKQDQGIQEELGDLENELKQAEGLLSEKPDTSKDTLRQIPAYVLLVVAIVGIVWILHRIFPDVKSHDLRFWAHMIVILPLAIGAFAVGFQLKKKYK